jgi:hypothetical protein
MTKLVRHILLTTPTDKLAKEAKNKARKAEDRPQSLLSTTPRGEVTQPQGESCSYPH